MIICHTCGNQIAEYSYNGFCSVDCYENQKPMKKKSLSRLPAALVEMPFYENPKPINCPQGLAAPFPLVAVCGDCRQCVNLGLRGLVGANAGWLEGGDDLIWGDGTMEGLQGCKLPGFSPKQKGSIILQARTGNLTILK